MRHSRLDIPDPVMQRPRFGAHARLEQYHLVTAASFGSEKGGIGIAHKCCALLTRGDIRHTNADGDHMPHIMIGLENRVLDLVPDDLADNLALCCAGFGQKYAEFLAANAADQIIFAQRLAEYLAEKY